MEDPSILDYFRDQNFLNHIINGNAAESAWPGQAPQQSTNVAGVPPMPPASVMGPSPNGGVDQPGLVQPPASPPNFTLPQGAQPPNQPPLPPAMPAPPPGPPPSFNDRAAPVRSAIAKGDFDPQGTNFTDFNLAPLQPPPMGSRPGVPYTQSQVAAPNFKDPTAPTIDRTTRNGMSPSLDDAALARPAPAGQPIDIRSPAQRGGPDPRIERSRAFGNFIASLGKGLTAVGGMHPGTNGASAFAAGAGGALTGHTENERHNQDRDEKGLDRSERARERNQTFDYQNRTLIANTKYHDDLVEQHRLDRDSKANAERYFPVGQTAEGKIIYQDRNHPGKEIQGENSVVSRTGAGNQGGNNERLARIIQAEHGKDADGNFKITMEEANNRARSAPKDSADTLRRERMAREDLKYHEQSRTRDEPKKSLEDFRRALGLPPPPPTPPPPGSVPPGSRSPLHDQDKDPALMQRQGPKFNGRVEAPLSPNSIIVPTPPGPAPVRPPVAAPPATRSAFPTPQPPAALNPAPGPAAPAPQPPRPPHVPPGAQFSAQKGKWYVRGPSGQPIEVPAPTP